jgi:hypothetical protein
MEKRIALGSRKILSKMGYPQIPLKQALHHNVAQAIAIALSFLHQYSPQLL